jgi:hypothetical protein
MLAAMGRPVEARALAAEAAKADPALAGPWEIEASLLDREKRTAEAKAAYAKAAAAGSKRAHVYYRLAQLEWTPDADKAAREGLAANLEKARALDPESADTLAFLADLRVDLDQPEEALALATKAVEIEPAESYHRLARARALWALQRSDEAVAMARSALAAADSDDERRHAQSFLDFAARAGGPSAAARPSARAADPGAAAAAETTNAGTPDADELARACRAGARTACAGEAFLRAVQARPGSTEATLALSRLERLCDDGIEAGCLSWASALARLGAPSADQQKARDIVETICDNKNAQACALLKSLPR